MVICLTYYSAEDKIKRKPHRYSEYMREKFLNVVDLFVGGDSS